MSRGFGVVEYYSIRSGFPFNTTISKMDSIKSEKERFEATLHSLNQTQRDSVLSDLNTLQILAGPGSGKTKVLTCRVAYFVVEKCVSPNRIIVVTFTNKAANEMKKRLNYLIGEKKTNELLIGTFHAICSRFLRAYAKLVNLDSNFLVADTETSKDIIQKLTADRQLKISNFTREKMKVGAIWGLISKAKNNGETCVTYAKNYGSDFKTKDIAILFTRYEAELKKLNLVDFDNLLMKFCELLRKRKNILSNIEAILVDEYQDTNVVQYDLIKLMKMQDNNKTVTIVGDPDQSIYGFRNADPKNFKKMQNDFLDTGVINMEQNYRSTGTILKAALHVITQDSTRFNKTLHTNNPDGKPIVRISTANEESQAEFVATEIAKIIKGSKGLINYKDIAVLMRMNFISRQFEGIFRHHKIPFTIVGGDRFFDRVEIKDIISYLNFAYNPKDSLSFNRIINVPKRGIGETNLKKIVQRNEMDKTDFLETIMDIGMSNSGSFNASIRKKLLDLGAICSSIKEMMTKKDEVPKIIRYLLEAIKYNDYLKEHYFQDYEARWNNIGELISLAQKQPSADDEHQAQSNQDGIEIDLTSDDEADEDEDNNYQPQSMVLSKIDEKPETDHITDFLEYCSLCSNQKELEEAEGGKVVIATLHASKGMEWPCVFIATCNEGVVPLSRAESVEEECRLLYVGMTRSKFLLYLVSPKIRNIWGCEQQQHPSNFLEGMNNNLYSTMPPEWDDETMMLAQTVLKTSPTTNNLKRSSDEDDGRTSKGMKINL